MKIARYRAYGEDGQVVHSGKPNAEGVAEFESDAAVAKVVFYTGPQESESVAGSVDIGRGGKISAGMPEA